MNIKELKELLIDADHVSINREIGNDYVTKKHFPPQYFLALLADREQLREALKEYAQDPLSDLARAALEKSDALESEEK